MDLETNLPSHVDIEVVNYNNNTSRIVHIKVQCDMLSKYHKTCKLQGHEEEDCQVLHSELKDISETSKKDGISNKNKNEVGARIKKFSGKADHMKDSGTQLTRILENICLTLC